MVFPLLAFSYTSVMRPSVTKTSPTTTGRWYSNSCSPCSTSPPWAITPPITFMTAPLSASASGRVARTRGPGYVCDVDVRFELEDSRMPLLADKVAIVTGAGHGVGRGEALELAAEGAKVVVNDLGGSVGGGGADKRPAEEVADLIRSRGGEAVANYEDVADWKGAQSLIQQAVDTFGRLD